MRGMRTVAVGGGACSVRAASLVKAEYADASPVQRVDTCERVAAVHRRDLMHTHPHSPHMRSNQCGGTLHAP